MFFWIIAFNKLVDSSFRNWKGMSESGGRRIKRAIHIDLNSIKFCDKQMIEKFRNKPSITIYLLPMFNMNDFFW